MVSRLNRLVPIAMLLLLAGLTPALAEEGSLLNPDALTEQAPDMFKAKFETTKGDFVIEVHRDWAPLGADRFYNLVKAGFYNDVAFFRVVPRFVVQFGIHGNPEVSKAWREANIQDDPVKESNKKWYVTYAKSNRPHSRTTQVFINLRNNSSLDAMGFAPFGVVSEGTDVILALNDKYNEQPTGQQGQMMMQGNAYLKETFPDLDYSVKASIVE